MKPPLNTVALAGNQVSQALPLVQVTWPEVDAAAWLRFVRSLTSRTEKSGVLALQDAADYLCGLLVYEVENDLRAGLILTIHVFTAMDLANSAEVVQALLEAATLKAVDFGCTGVQIRVSGEQAALAARVRGLGYTERAGYLWKRIALPPNES